MVCTLYIFKLVQETMGRRIEKAIMKLAWSTFEEEFRNNMSKLGEVSLNATNDLMNYPPHTWVRAYFSGRCKSWVVDNNMVESFNA